MCIMSSVNLRYFNVNYTNRGEVYINIKSQLKEKFMHNLQNFLKTLLKSLKKK